MIALLSEFQERLGEVEAYLDFLAVVEARAQHGPPRLDGAEHPITVQQQRILYSAVYLQLYNLVESTMARCIEAVELATSQHGRRPGDLSSSMRSEWVRAIARTHESLTPENRLESALRLCDHLVSSLPLEGFKLDKKGGGNWDDKAIENFTRRIGITLEVTGSVYRAIKRPFRDEMGPLELIKYLRNKLAHGAVSFAECASEVTVSALVELKEHTVAYLREVVSNFCEFIENAEYLELGSRSA